VLRCTAHRRTHAHTDVGTSRSHPTRLVQGSFPVDAVYTWVNGSDPVWAAARQRYSNVFQHPIRTLPHGAHGAANHSLIEPLNPARAHSSAVLRRRCSAAGGCRPRRCRRMATPTAASPTTVRGPARPGRRGRFWMRFVAVLSHWLLVRASASAGPCRSTVCFVSWRSDSRWRVPFLCVCLFVCAPAEDGGTPFFRRVLACHSRS
jgi:hypothetical protein